MKGFLLEFGIGAKVPNASMMGLPDGRKSFMIGLVVSFPFPDDPEIFHQVLSVMSILVLVLKDIKDQI